MEQVKQYVVADGLIDLGVKGGTFVRMEDYAALQQKLDAVLAENAALKESRKRLGEFIIEEIDADYPLNMEIQTPATDDILNEVRAEAELEGMVRGAGRVALEASRVYRDAPTRSEERSLHKRIGDFAHMIARRIRAEGATND